MNTAPYEATCVTKVGEIVLNKQYLIKNEEGQVIEKPEDLFWRVAVCAAEAERLYGATDEETMRWAEQFYGLMATGKFQPNTPTLINAGRNNGLGYSACFVLPINDSLVEGNDSIYGTLVNMAAIHKTGGGTGFSFSNLRPSGDLVRKTSGVASGPISFMTLYDSSTEVVKQGGTRRGANMGVMLCTHPEIMDFITCKSDTNKITNFNISVAVTDAFMEAVYAERDWDLTHPQTGEVIRTVSAVELFQSIINQAHTTGEPGLFFIDEANRYNPVPHLGSYETTNPCGEQPLLSHDTCNLGSINVSMYYGQQNINYVALRKDIEIATRFLDNIIDVNNYPIPEITRLSQRIRRIGLGIMGWADLLVNLRIPYGSEESFETAKQMMRVFNNSAHDASTSLAEERGVFPEWEKSIWGPDETCARDKHGERIREEKQQRNCNVTTVAPTGSISIIAGCSGGIEPLFAVGMLRKQADTKILDINQDFLRVAKAEQFDSEAVINHVTATGNVHHPDVPELWQNIFRTAHDITPEQHVAMQAAFQEHCDSAISKTVNLHTSATTKDVEDVFIAAHKLHCKGVTVYRDGARPGQTLTAGQTKAPIKLRTERPEFRPGFTREIAFGELGKLHITVNTDPRDGELLEVFLNWGKAGSDQKAFIEAIGRLISVAIQEGISPQEVINQLIGIQGKTNVFHKGSFFLSIPDAIAKTMLAANEELVETQQLGIFEIACPDCKTKLILTEGCKKCPVCGYSTCG
jgi:ribonucleoside-diphosphate reductase alpha chain